MIFKLLLVFVPAYALKHTAWERHVYAVGDDPEAVELSGVNVKKTLMSVSLLSGIICAFASWAMVGQLAPICNALGSCCRRPPATCQPLLRHPS